METNELTFDNLVKVLEEYGQKVRNLYQDNLINEDKIATGNLINSVEFSVKQDGRIFGVVLELEKYWKYVEYGRRAGAKRPPVNAILEWIKAKPVIPREKNGKLPTDKELAFLIARSIGEKGIKPTLALTKAVDVLNEEYVKKIQLAFMKDIEGRLRSAFSLIQFI